MPTFFKWVYLVEKMTGPEVWEAVSTHDSAVHAVREAERFTFARVRQFQVSTIPFVLKSIPERFKFSMPENTTLVSFFCPTHPKETIKATATSLPRCKECKQTMFRGVGIIKDLSTT